MLPSLPSETHSLLAFLLSPSTSYHRAVDTRLNLCIWSQWDQDLWNQSSLAHGYGSTGYGPQVCPWLKIAGAKATG